MVFMPIVLGQVFLKIAAVLFVLCSLTLILIVLIQKGRGGGLSAALGGGMASSLLGTKTGDVLTWVTIGVVGVFLTLAVILAKYYKPAEGQYGQTPETTQSAPETIPGGTSGTPETQGLPTENGTAAPEQQDSGQAPATEGTAQESNAAGQ